MGVPKRWTCKSPSKQHPVKGTFRTIMALNFFKKGILQGYHQEHPGLSQSFGVPHFSASWRRKQKKYPLTILTISHYISLYHHYIPLYHSLYPIYHHYIPLTISQYIPLYHHSGWFHPHNTNLYSIFAVDPHEFVCISRLSTRLRKPSWYC